MNEALMSAKLVEAAIGEPGGCVAIRINGGEATAPPYRIEARKITNGMGRQWQHVRTTWMREFFWPPPTTGVVWQIRVTGSRWAETVSVKT